MKRFIIAGLLLVAIALNAQPINFSAAQNTGFQKNFSGSWQEWDKHLGLYPSVTTATDTFYFAGVDSVIIGPFLVWPYMTANMAYADTVAANDSIHIVSVDFFQFFDPTTTWTTTVFNSQLSWKSHTSSTGATAITATGSYGANIGSNSTYLVNSYGWLRVELGANNRVLNGNYFMLKLTGWNPSLNVSN